MIELILVGVISYFVGRAGGIRECTNCFKQGLKDGWEDRHDE